MMNALMWATIAKHHLGELERGAGARVRVHPLGNAL